MTNWRPFLSVILGLALAGCGGGDDNGNAHNQASLRVIHAGADAPKVNVLANQSALVDELDYGQSSGFKTVPVRSYNVDINAVLPDQTTPTVLTERYNLRPERNYSAVAVGSVADNTLDVVVIENADSPVPDGYVRLQVLHGSPAAPTVDVYVTAPSDDITGASPALTLSYQQFSDQLEVPAGDYRIRITPTGADTVVFDSGTVPLAAGADLLITAIPNVYAGSTAPVALLAANGTDASVIFDANTGAEVRAVHGAADAPAVDVLLNDDPTPVATDLTYLNETPFLTVPVGSQDVTINVPSLGADVLKNIPVTLEVGKFYNAVVLGTVVSDSFDLELVAFSENRRKVATEAKISLVHGSVSAGTVDVYITPTDDIANASPAIANFEYKQSVTGVAVMPGEAVISITPAGSKTVAIGPLAVNFEGGKLYGAVAQDATGIGTPLTVNGFDELN